MRKWKNILIQSVNKGLRCYSWTALLLYTSLYTELLYTSLYTALLYTSLYTELFVVNKTNTATAWLIMSFKFPRKVS